MTGSRRSVPLPRGWAKIRAHVLERDRYRCMWGMLDGETDGLLLCSNRATEVDHIGDPGNHHYYNLRSLCRMHHTRRTSAQANTARWSRVGSKKRATPKHPGLVDP